jgi:DNA polymerase-3 subunit delta
MANLAERALRKAIREKTLERVHYFFGEDDFLKESAARELMAAAVDARVRDFNQDVMRGSEVSPEQLATALNTLPMLSTQRLVTIREVHSLSRPARALLETYVQRPAAETVLLLLTPASEKADSFLTEHASATEFGRLTADRVRRWIAHYSDSTLGVEITPEAAGLLQETFGSDLSSLAAELDKMCSYNEGRLITAETVAAVAGVRAGESLGDLLDAVARRDGAAALALVPRVLALPRTTVVSVLMALATQFLAIGWGAARGARRGALEREFFALLRETRTSTGRPWGEAVTSWSQAMSFWSGAEADDALILLLAADHAAKETRLSSDDQLLGSLVLALCAAGHRAAA